MTGMKSLNDAMAALLAADTATLAEATPFVEIVLVKAPIPAGDALVPADLSLADFDGYAAKHAASAATQVFSDPATNDTVLQANEPAGGWHWATTGLTNLPQTIYGFAMLNAAGTVVLGVETLDTPITLNASGQGVDIGDVRFRLPAGALN